jgi:CubicO group peptidase (beta-lactamase class C family)
MRRIGSSMLAALVIGVAACGGGSGGGATAPPRTGFVATSVESALEYAVDRGVDGIWVYVDDGVTAPEFKAAGVQNRDSLEPARLTALFKIASISKVFIATSSVKLVSGGLLRLDDTLSTWLPTVAMRIDNGDAITVRHLLQHRSGVPDFDSQPGFSWREPHSDLEALLALVYDKPADFAPDAMAEYSNTNYLLLGMILDAALGYSHHEFVQSEILTPLGMVDTYSLLADVDTSLLARGYWDATDRTEQDYAVPGGSMVSTAPDVGAFFRALATGDLLTGDERSLFLDLFGGYGHSGWLPGYQSIARYDAAMDTVLVQFVNTTGGQSEDVARTVYNSLIAYLRKN